MQKSHDYAKKVMIMQNKSNIYESKNQLNICYYKVFVKIIILISCEVIMYFEYK